MCVCVCVRVVCNQVSGRALGTLKERGGGEKGVCGIVMDYGTFNEGDFFAPAERVCALFCWFMVYLLIQICVCDCVIEQLFFFFFFVMCGLEFRIKMIYRYVCYARFLL